MDAVRLIMEEKEESHLSDVAFISLPAIKIGKLATICLSCSIMHIEVYFIDELNARLHPR